MLRFLFLIAFIYLQFTICTGQKFFSKDSILSRDSLIFSNELIFSSKTERELFIAFEQKHNPDDGLCLISAEPDSSYNYNSMIKQLNTDINYLNDKTKKLNDKKKVDFIYKYIHEKYFDKYLEQTHFTDIFTKKTYNCLTASILYAWIFEKIHIPYVARVSVNHVYLVAYPNSGSIVIETTNPLLNINTISESFKNDYVNTLRQGKIISSDEIKEFSNTQLFNKFYYSEEIADFRDLIGGHYKNRCIEESIDKSNFIKAFNLSLISHFLSPCHQSLVLILFNGSGALKEDYYKTNKSAYIIGLFSRFDDYGIQKEMIEGEISNLTAFQLVDKKDTILFRETYKTLTMLVRDSTWLEKLNYFYNCALSFYYLSVYNYNQGLLYAEKAFYSNPEDKYAQNMLYAAISVINGTQTDLYTEQQLTEKIENYFDYYPGLSQNIEILSIRISDLCKNAEEAYGKGRIIEGDSLLIKLESILPVSDSYNIEYQMQEVYVSASFWYYKKYNNKKAKEYIERGLKYFPENCDLKRRLKAF